VHGRQRQCSSSARLLGGTSRDGNPRQGRGRCSGRIAYQPGSLAASHVTGLQQPRFLRVTTGFLLPRRSEKGSSAAPVGSLTLFESNCGLGSPVSDHIYGR
jgi:hypothetical protein